jgi:hypothetical protein
MALGGAGVAMVAGSPTRCDGANVRLVPDGGTTLTGSPGGLQTAR